MLDLEIHNVQLLFLFPCPRSPHFCFTGQHWSQKSINWNVFYNVQYVIMWSTFEAQAQARFGEEDYWSQDFDQEQNCAQKERIIELQGKVRCYILSMLLPRKFRRGVMEHVSAPLRWSRLVFLITAITIRRTRPVPSTCAKCPSPDRFSSFSSFLLKIALQVQRLCDFTAVKSSGKLLYCYNRGCMSETWANLSNSISECQTFSGMITCCFDEHQCVKDWVEMQEHALDVARLVWTTKMSL